MLRCLILLSVGLFVSRVVQVQGLPIQLTVNQRGTECLYDTLQEGERVTLSVFILSGAALKATVRLEGPIAPLSTDTGLALNSAAEEFEGKWKEPENHLTYSQVVDFEHLNETEEDDDEDERNDDDAGAEDKEGQIDPNDPDATAKRRERRERQREKFLANRQKRETKKLLKQRKIREDGEPFQWTEKAPSDGWYRVCVHGTWYQVVAEIEMRKESELGGMDEDGHVVSYERKMMDEEDKELDEDTALAEGIKDEDFQETRDKLKDLRRLLNEIQSMQQKERRRMTNHAETNDHSHSRMVMSSLMETLIFMGVTGFQVYTIRKWFSAAPVLGR